MIDRATVFEIHRLRNLGFSVQHISKRLHLDWKTVNKYLKDPTPRKSYGKRKSKLDPFKGEIDLLLKIDPDVSAVVIKQKIEKQGYDGGLTILRDHLKDVLRRFGKEAFIRFESPPGRQMQVDWGHFGSLAYGNAKRKLYCLAVIECHSRMLCVEFVHSRKQQVLHKALFHAFTFFGGTPEEIVVDNMMTAVIERRGPIIRFNDAFLDFLRPFRITPVACNVRSPHEKGKVEHATVTIYHREKKIARHPRCFEKRKGIESPAHLQQVKKLRRRMWQDKDVLVLSSIGPEVVEYLGALADANQPIRKSVVRLLSLKQEYGGQSLIFAIRKAMLHKAYGADYIENILYREMTPVRRHQPVKLKDDELNRIRLNEPSLREYDACIIKKKRQTDDRRSKK